MTRPSGEDEPDPSPARPRRRRSRGETPPPGRERVTRPARDSARGGRDLPRRVRVTSPRSQARRRPPQRTLSSEIGEQTELGEVYVTSLMRAQLRLSMVVSGGVGVALGLLPAVVILVPPIGELRVGPIPLSWMLVGAMLYPFLLLVARSYNRAAERVERDFGDLLEAET